MNSYTDEVKAVMKVADGSKDTYKEIEILTKGLEKYPNSPDLKIALAFSLSMVNRISENENEQIVDKFRFLKDTLQEYPAAIIDFDVEMFEALVEKISVSHNGTLTFVLKGNLLLKEGVEVKRKCA